MRELKFKAWDKTGKCWVPNYTFAIEIGGRGFTKSGDLIFNGQNTYPLNREFEIVQFTGLKDKNGIEIYEGDIVIQYPGFGCEFKPRQGFVEYEFTSFWLKHKGYSNVLDDHDSKLEIIGNIYDNPELLK